MLYPLSYEGGGVFVLVRGYFSSFAVEGGVRFQPAACPFFA